MMKIADLEVVEAVLVAIAAGLAKVADLVIVVEEDSEMIITKQMLWDLVVLVEARYCHF